ncbi:hypothetical protein [Caryophanon latum]|uniref:Uncharacterized protein n=1 Tax=Caryophanon latum TaxID=33977 RepID=A0A1C0YCK0_9BACL|nr:hypothetical protein [Caryophanon latum]OCS84863.1 hypothetical protein A6K76_15440 [Caryophanon latum]
MSIKDKYTKDKQVTHPTAGAAEAVIQTSVTTEETKPVKKEGKKATFILPEDLHYELKEAAVKLRCNMSDLVAESLRKTLDELKSK